MLRFDNLKTNVNSMQRNNIGKVAKWLQCNENGKNHDALHVRLLSPALLVANCRVVFSLVLSPSFSRIGRRARFVRGRKKKGLVHLYAHALLKSHESHYKIIT